MTLYIIISGAFNKRSQVIQDPSGIRILMFKECTGHLRYNVYHVAKAFIKVMPVKIYVFLKGKDSFYLDTPLGVDYRPRVIMTRSVVINGQSTFIIKLNTALQ